MKLEFHWDILEVIIGGKSLLDSPLGLTGFPMSSLEDADRFMHSYGFNLNDPIQGAEALGNLHEAISFVRKYFLKPENPEGLGLEIPRKILELTDVRELLLMASSTHPSSQEKAQDFLLRNWACALLKVIHTIVHMDRDIRVTYFADIQKQVFDRYYKVVHRDSNGKLTLGDSVEDALAVRLHSFETKPKKSRESMLIKLLHKPENVADEIFDRVGLRFITESKIDALRVVKFLKDRMIVMPSNVKPSRSRNTLVDMELLQKAIEKLNHQWDRGELRGDDYRAELEKSVQTPQVEKLKGVNPHSSEFYRAIQFTSRQWIKLKNPLYDDLKQLKSLAKKSEGLSEELSTAIHQIDLQFLQREVSFFYPYEVQITDRISHEENQQGLGAHSEYKKAQIQTVMSRVMGSLIHAEVL